MHPSSCLGGFIVYCFAQAEIECVVEMYTADKEEALLHGNPDFVIDAIDNLDTKVRWGGRGGADEAAPIGAR